MKTKLRKGEGEIKSCLLSSSSLRLGVHQHSKLRALKEIYCHFQCLKKYTFKHITIMKLRVHLLIHVTVLNSNDLEPKKASCFTFFCVSFFSSACYCDELMMGSSSVKHTRQINHLSAPKLQP